MVRRSSRLASLVSSAVGKKVCNLASTHIDLNINTIFSSLMKISVFFRI